MNARIGWKGLLILLISFFSLSSVQTADEPDIVPARVSLVNGDVSVMRGDSGDWVTTTVNAPLVQGDKISTGLRSRTEIQLDQSNIIRLDQQTEARIAALSNSRIQVQVAQGQLNLTVFSGNKTDVEIDTPNVALHPLEEGIYRIRINSESETDVVCRKGGLEVLTQQGSTRIRGNDQIVVRGEENPEYRIAKAAGTDEWDQWNQDRDYVISDAQSWQYTNQNYIGTYDLDHYGNWEDVPGYGYTWSPYSVDSSWAPYSDGRWSWEPYWGWTWVSYEPWGWAPYHYGRWFVHAGRWCWWPGPVYSSYRPLWAPAYVSFLGFGYSGHNWGFGFGYGYNSIGWLPLGPCDSYYPWYGTRHGHAYSAVNITNVTNVGSAFNSGYHGSVIPPLADSRTRPYISNVQSVLNNETVRRSVNALTTPDFVRGRVVGRARSTLDTGTIQKAQFVAGTIPVVPTRESLRLTDRPVNRSSLPTHTVSSERLFTRNQPVSATQSFSQQAAQIRQMVQRQGKILVQSQNSPSPTTTSGTARGAFPHGTGNQGNTTLVPGGSATQRVLNSGSNRETTSQSPQSSANSRGNSSWTRFGSGQRNSRVYTNEDLQQRSSGHGNVGAVNTLRKTASGVQTQSQQRSNNQSTAERQRSAGGSNAVNSPSSRTNDPNWSRFPSYNGSSPNSNWRGQSGQTPRSQPSQVYAPRESPRPMGQTWSTYGSDHIQYHRPPLQLAKPIVTERPPQTYNGGGNRGGQIQRQSPAQQRSGGGHSSPSSRSSGNRGRR